MHQLIILDQQFSLLLSKRYMFAYSLGYIVQRIIECCCSGILYLCRSWIILYSDIIYVMVACLSWNRHLCFAHAWQRTRSCSYTPTCFIRPSNIFLSLNYIHLSLQIWTIFISIPLLKLFTFYFRLFFLIRWYYASLIIFQLFLFLLFY